MSAQLLHGFLHFRLQIYPYFRQRYRNISRFFTIVQRHTSDLLLAKCLIPDPLPAPEILQKFAMLDCVCCLYAVGDSKSTSICVRIYGIDVWGSD